MTIRTRMVWCVMLQIVSVFFGMALLDLIISWLSVIPRAEAIRRGFQVPATWQLVRLPISTHYGSQHPIRWPFGTVGEHPLLFCAAIAAWIGFLYLYGTASCNYRSLKKKANADAEIA